MAECLIALGSNLGDRAAHLGLAVDEVAAASRIRIVSRSAWHDTPPIGGPSGQWPFLNGVVLATTDLEPAALLALLRHIETLTGRVRTERWGARTLDLDVLLFGDVETESPELVVPHPRMHFRRFVLEPAAEVAPWMTHPTSGWTIAQLLKQLDGGPHRIAIAAASADVAGQLAAEVNAWLDAAARSTSAVRPWTASSLQDSEAQRPKLLLAVAPSTGEGELSRRKMLQLPMTGPVAWLAPGTGQRLFADAQTVVMSAWPETSATRVGE